jgi:hypothetical protein
MLHPVQDLPHRDLPSLVARFGLLRCSVFQPSTCHLKAALAGVLLAWLCLLQGAYGLANLAPEVRDPANFFPPRILVGADSTTSIKPSRPQTLDRQRTASGIPDFLSREPLGETESLNLYSYCHNDPINYVDVLGLAERSILSQFFFGIDPIKIEPSEREIERRQGRQQESLRFLRFLKEFENGQMDIKEFPLAMKEAFIRQQAELNRLNQQRIEQLELVASGPQIKSIGESPPMVSVAALSIGGATTEFNASINRDWLLPTGAGTAGAKFLFGGMKTMLPVLAAGVRTEARVLTAEMQMGEVAANTGAVADGSIYSTTFQTTLRSTLYPGASRAAHFQEANGALLQAMEGSTEVAARMQGLGINVQRTATGLAPRQSPQRDGLGTTRPSRESCSLFRERSTLRGVFSNQHFIRADRVEWQHGVNRYDTDRSN